MAQPNPYRRGAIILFVLGLLSIGSSNILSYFTAPTLATIEPISIFLIPIYFGTAFFTWRQSLLSYRIGMAAFIVSGIVSLGVSFVNMEKMNAVAGGSGFTSITFLNIIYVVVIARILISTHKALPAWRLA